MRLVTIFNVQQILINYVSLLFQTQMLTLVWVTCTNVLSSDNNVESFKIDENNGVVIQWRLISPKD